MIYAFFIFLALAVALFVYSRYKSKRTSNCTGGMAEVILPLLGFLASSVIAAGLALYIWVWPYVVKAFS